MSLIATVLWAMQFFERVLESAFRIQMRGGFDKQRRTAEKELKRSEKEVKRYESRVIVWVGSRARGLWLGLPKGQSLNSGL